MSDLFLEEPFLEGYKYSANAGLARAMATLVEFNPRAKSTATRTERLTHRRINPYSITFPEDACEAHGGHATVSKAFLSLSQEGGAPSGSAKAVTVKKARVADDTDVERVLGLTVREAKFLLELDHPNIVELGGFAEDVSNNIIWLVFPWADNGNLGDFIASRDWEIAEKISLIDDVVRGLEYLHSQEPPICHGDLKSLNILVTWMYHAVITDFGSARRLVHRDIDPEQIESQSQSVQPLQATFCISSNTITLTGNKYTLRWAAPELLTEDRLGLWSDIWALGWIAYEAMTNSIPFQDVSTDVIVVERVLQEDLPSPTRIAYRWLKNFVHGLDGKRIQLQPIQTKHEVLPSYSEALQISASIGGKQGEAENFCGLAELHRIRGEHNEAAALFFKTSQISTNLGDREIRADALRGLADSHRALGEYNQAITTYAEAFQLYKDTDDRLGSADTLLGLADVYRDQNRQNDAAYLYEQAARILEQIGHRRPMTDALLDATSARRLLQPQEVA